jgi:hypothetical protein
MGKAPSWFLSLLQVPFCNWNVLSNTPGEVIPSIWPTGPLSTVTLLRSRGCQVPARGRWKHLLLWVPDEPHECYRNLKQKHRKPRLFGK